MDINYNDFRKLSYTSTSVVAFKRGCFAIEQGDLEGAVLDFSNAISTEPNLRRHT